MPNRLLTVDALSTGERCVADLTELVGLDMSTVSNHLSVLRSVGLVADDRRGTQVFYTLSNSCVMNIFCCLEEFRAEGADWFSRRILCYFANQEIPKGQMP